jgi:signal transduction histidine kinase
MAIVSRTERRVALAIVLTAVIPLIVFAYQARVLFDQIAAQANTPELNENLDRALGAYQDLVTAIKSDMRHQADAIAAREPLRAAALLRHPPSIQQELDAAFPQYSDLVSLGIALPDGTIIGKKDRGRPVDVATERELEVRRPLSDGDDAPQLVAIFATPRARIDEPHAMSEFIRTYHGMLKLQRVDLYWLGAVLVVTIGITVTIGTLLARSVTRRIGGLAAATQTVASGDLTVRVPEQGNDELTDLSRSFNRMLSEVEMNRARVEFLQRMSTWQEMARRLAHEIKNPLTPILLAVEECHRKYDGSDPNFRKLLDTTLEIVEEEVGTLRRLVGEFSSFARLPRAELAEGDLGDFLRDQASHAHLVRDESDPTRSQTPPFGSSKVEVAWKIPDEPMPANIDRQMLRQVLSNILRNATQAVVAHRGQGRVEVSVTPEREAFIVNIDDDGPGVPEPMRDSVFDPYVTTKADGTGLGLSIVKKIVVEHGGTVDVAPSPLGGARFRIRIPRLASPAAQAVRDMRTTLSRSGVRSA